MTKILIVDDSATETALLKALFETEPTFTVIGTATNGKVAIELTERLRPDVITMDIHMPVINGFEATRAIMSQFPTPIIVISSKLNDESMRASFLALEAGAVGVLDKPKHLFAPEYAKEREKIIEMVKVMSGLKVIKRRFHNLTQPVPMLPSSHIAPPELIALGASVGGPQALKTIFSRLPADFPIPIVVVQHMMQGFLTSFAKWLNENSLLTAKTAEDHELLKPSTIYFAPDNCHLTIVRTEYGLMTNLQHGPPVSGFCPSITTLFESVATSCGKNSVGILLTGMGSDGAQGMCAIKHAQGHTFIQDPASTVVFGMAGVAQSMNAVDRVVELDNIADYLIKLASNVPEKV